MTDAVASRLKLSDEEYKSLCKMCECGCARDIPPEHADRLMDLGLAELTCCGLGPTSAGKRGARLSVH